MADRSSTVVFGGRGFVGAAICRELARRSAAPVISVSRSGQAGPGGDLGPGVEHRAGVDALQPESYKVLLSSARAVVISVGEVPWAEQTGGSKERAVKMNGMSNVSVLKAAAEAQVPRVVLVNATMPSWGLIQGYREGKEMAEAAAQLYPEESGLGTMGCSVLVLKPGAIAGTRYWGSLPLPLGLVMAPQRFMMRCLAGPCKWVEGKLPGVFGGVLRPAVWVDEIAEVSVDVILADFTVGVKVLEPDAVLGYKSTA